MKKRMSMGNVIILTALTLLLAAALVGVLTLTVYADSGYDDGELIPLSLF